MRTKELLRWNKKAFLSIFEGLSLKQIKIIFFGRCEFDFKWTLIKTVSALFLIMCRTLGIWHSFRMWLNNNSWHDRFANSSKTAEKYEKMRHRFKDSCNMNILNWKLYRKINSIRTWSSWKVEFLSEIASFLPLKFRYANYLFPIQRVSSTFFDPVEYWF